MANKYSPAAPQGPPDTYEPSDPQLPPFGGSSAILHGMVSGTMSPGIGDLVTGPQMNPDKVSTVTMRSPRRTPPRPSRMRIGMISKGY